MHEGSIIIHSTVPGPVRNHKTDWGAKGNEAFGWDFGVKAPFDIATGHTSGKRRHNPLVVTKEWGAASPQLFQSCVTREILHAVVIQFARPNQSGAESVYHTITLTNATVAHAHYVGGGKHRVTFVYQEIEITGGTPPPGLHLIHHEG